MKLDKRILFLLDGFGAFVTALFMGVLLPLFSEELGIPVWILRGFALVGVLFCIFSLFCYWRVQNIQRAHVLTIITANSLYCLFTAGVGLTLETITPLGLTYIVLEIIIILSVIAMEVRVLRTAFVPQ